MRKLHFRHRLRKLKQFDRQRARRGAKAVPGDLRLRRIAHAAECRIDRVVRDSLVLAPLAGEDIARTTRLLEVVLQDLDGLLGQRHKVGLAVSFSPCVRFSRSDGTIQSP
ncbi:MAG TPA: hypothetical protein VLK85_20490 [Ramlibacter sp.]|nr:hypothetical protein [Ramlibacter sp.]